MVAFVRVNFLTSLKSFKIFKIFKTEPSSIELKRHSHTPTNVPREQDI